MSIEHSSAPSTTASPLPLRPAIDHTTRARSALDLSADRTGTVFEALGSETARSVLVALGEAPAAASDIADRIDTSLQNVQYHLRNLKEADLVAEVGTWYSSRGKEMTVYGPTVDRLEFRVAEKGAEDETAADGDTAASRTAVAFDG